LIKENKGETIAQDIILKLLQLNYCSHLILKQITEIIRPDNSNKMGNWFNTSRSNEWQDSYRIDIKRRK